MDPVLQSLIRYQDLCLELGRLTARLDRFPDAVKAIESELAAAVAALEAARGAVSDHQKERRRLESDLQDLETRLSKYNDQLMQVKTNEEYKAMQHEIAAVKEKIGAVEEKILLLMEESDTGERRVNEERARLEQKRREAETRKEAVRHEQRQVQEETARVAAAQEAARGGLAPEVLDLFNRIAQNRNGIALARARDERCQECNVRLRPQVFQEIKKNDRIIQCDSCRRILYYIAEAPAADAPA